MITNIAHIVAMSLPTSRVSVSSSMSYSTTPIAADPAQDSTLRSAANDVQGVEAENTLAAAIDHLNTNIQRLDRNLVFSLDKDSGDVVVKVVDSETHEVIRQIPNEDVLALARHIKQYELDHHVGLMQAEA
jgi:flagellar protein FlaG